MTHWITRLVDKPRFAVAAGLSISIMAGVVVLLLVEDRISNSRLHDLAASADAAALHAMTDRSPVMGAAALLGLTAPEIKAAAAGGVPDGPGPADGLLEQCREFFHAAETFVVMLGRSGRLTALLSPEGVVMSSSRTDWVFRTVAEPTPARMKALRASRRFSDVFDATDAAPLQFSPADASPRFEGGRHALVTLPVDWSDPGGLWSLVVLEDEGPWISPETKVAVFTVAATGWSFLLLWLFSLASRAVGMKRKAEELRIARERAEDATRAKSSFLAMMSHEIRTPMNGVMAMAEMLDQTELVADQRGMLGVIRSSAKSVLTIINNILDFSKIEAGKVEHDDGTTRWVTVSGRDPHGQALRMRGVRSVLAREPGTLRKAPTRTVAPPVAD